MKKTITAIFLVIICSFLSFSQKNGNNNEVYRVNEKFDVLGSQIFYALPKNKIEIKIKVKKTEVIQGPYAKYALKYLNISEGIASSDLTYYDIVDVKIKRYSVADSSNFYVINNVNSENTPLISLTGGGVIVAYNTYANTDIEDTEPQNMITQTTEVDDFVFTDLGVKHFYKEKVEKAFKNVQSDTGIIQVPYNKTINKSATEEENAYEAASFIRKIRKRRAKLLFGMSDEVVRSDGDALKFRIKELNKLEQQYLDLFMGKKIEKKQTYSFEFTPSEVKNEEQFVICQFSVQDGLKTSKKALGRASTVPIILTVKNQNTLPKANIKTFDSSSKNNDVVHGLYYRIPTETSFTLEMQNKILLKTIISIAQKGEIMALPRSYMNGDFIIEYHPETGAIKSIRNRK